MPSKNLLLERTRKAGGTAIGPQPLARRLVLGAFEKMSDGALVVSEGGRVHRFGSMQDTNPARLEITNPEFFNLVLKRGLNGLAESFMDGHWTTTDLTHLLRTGIRNMSIADDLDGPLSWMFRQMQRASHILRGNSRRGSRRNITAHYDLGDEFFELFLDRTMSYSAAVFDREDEDLESASLRKIDLLCDKLELGPRDHLLEIGTGWGGFAIRAASRTGCRVSTTTISDNQYAAARHRVAEAGLEDRITVLKKDYRDLEGTYDKIVSCEMIEAVGHEYLPEFFATCDRLLRDDGRFALQAITIRDQNYDQARRYADFIKTYVFPGSCIPSVTRMLDCATSRTTMILADLQDIGLDYATTLRCWRESFLEKRDRAAAMGLEEPFLRMWEYYLAYCEAGFRERHISDVQMVFTKPRDTDPVARP